MPWLLLLMLLLSTYSHAKETQIYADMQLHAYTDTLALSELIDNWGGSYHGGEKAFIYRFIDAGVSYRGWGLATVSEEYMTLAYSKDAADFFYLRENKLPLQQDYLYDIRFKAEYASVKGVQGFARYSVTDKFELFVGVSLLQGKELLSGTLQGQVRPLSSNDYDYEDVFVDYYYSEDRLFDRSVDAPQGQGKSLRLALAWRFLDKHSLSLDIRNAYAYIDWRETPYTYAQVNADNKEYDANGYVIVHPTLSGGHQSLSFRQQLPRFSQLDYSYQLAQRLSAKLTLFDTPIQRFYQLGAIFHPSLAHQFSASYSALNGAITLEYLGPWLKFAITSDTTSANSAEQISLSLGLKYTL